MPPRFLTIICTFLLLRFQICFGTLTKEFHYSFSSFILLQLTNLKDNIGFEMLINLVHFFYLIYFDKNKIKSFSVELSSNYITTIIFNSIYVFCAIFFKTIPNMETSKCKYCA